MSGNEEQHRIASEATMERMRTQLAKQHTELKGANKDVELFEAKLALSEATMDAHLQHCLGVRGEGQAKHNHALAYLKSPK